MALRTLLLLALLASFGCPRGGDTVPVPAATSGDGSPPPSATALADETDLRVHDDNPNLLYSFLDERGEARLVSRAADVPPGLRTRVLVVDVNQGAAARQAHRVLTFANLDEKRPDGSYAVVPVSRYDASRGQSFEETLPVSSSHEVLVYSAEWCGFCKKAKAWLQREGVPFVERDVERQPGASRELEQKLKRAQLRGGGVPVIDWRGTVVVGFDQKRLSSLLAAERENAPAHGGQGP